MKEFLRVDDNNAVYWSNGKYLGYIYQEVDGYYVMAFRVDGRGSWQAHALRAIANMLDEKNKAWDEQVRKDFEQHDH